MRDLLLLGLLPSGPAKPPVPACRCCGCCCCLCAAAVPCAADCCPAVPLGLLLPLELAELLLLSVAVPSFCMSSRVSLSRSGTPADAPAASWACS